MANIIITLGAGHGGIDSGALGQTGLNEKDCNLAIAKKSGQILSNIGAFDVKLLRDSDAYIGVRERGQMAAKLGSRCHVEVHINAFDTKASYVEVFHSVDIQSDKPYAQKMSDRIANVLGVASKGAEVRYGSKDKNGAYTDYYGVIDAASDGGVPHIFFPECGFIDYAPTEALLKQQTTLDSIATAIAQTICELFGIAFNANTASVSSVPTVPPQVIPSPSQNLDKVKQGTYYVREKPGFNAKVIGTVKGGQAFYTVPAALGFKRIIFNGKIGYVGPGAW
jgi:N-acetylmuramoyl-L-alanine amidase